MEAHSLGVGDTFDEALEELCPLALAALIDPGRPTKGLSHPTQKEARSATSSF